MKGESRPQCFHSLAAAAWFGVVVANFSVSAATYEIGPGKTFTNLSAVAWESLQAGDTVLIRWRTNAYKERAQQLQGGHRNRFSIQPLRPAVDRSLPTALLDWKATSRMRLPTTPHLLTFAKNQLVASNPIKAKMIHGKDLLVRLSQVQLPGKSQRRRRGRASSGRPND